MRSLSRGFVLLTLVLGALTGVGIWLTIGLVQPRATSALVTTFVWAWATEWTFFAVEIAAAMVYSCGWDRLEPRTHVAVGWVYFVASWASLAVILLTGALRMVSWKVFGWTGDVAADRVRLLKIKHAVLGIVFAAGTAWQALVTRS